MHTLSHWKAKRAGGRITIYGKNEAGENAKVVGVDEIVGGTPHPIAIDKNGQQYALT